MGRLAILEHIKTLDPEKDHQRIIINDLSDLSIEPEMEKTPDNRSAKEDPRERTSGKAIAALVLGLGSFCLWILAAIPAIIFGILSLSEIGRSEGRLKGKGLAIAGIVIAGVNTILCVPVAIIGLSVPITLNVISEAKADAARAQMNGTIAPAVRSYSVKHGVWPRSVTDLLLPPDGEGTLPPEAIVDPWGRSYELIILNGEDIEFIIASEGPNAGKTESRIEVGPLR